ncbi:hypothetical protein QIG69_28660, partial [Klebsiella pneumoniae]|nr:hypothetical protein [Klebsiella pneumoniae]
CAVNGGVIFVFGHEPDFSMPPPQTLHRGFVADAGHHDLTVVGILLGPHHHLVAAENAGIYHAVTPYPQS